MHPARTTAAAIVRLRILLFEQKASQQCARGKGKRRGRESNPRIAVLQTADLTTWLPRRLRAARVGAAREHCQRTPRFDDSRALSIEPVICRMMSRSSQLFAAARAAHSRWREFAGARVSRHWSRTVFCRSRARRTRLWDVDGNRIHRLRRHLGPGDSGSRSARRVDAMSEAAARGVSFGIPNPLEVEMAELICRWVPSIEKVRMVNSGTEATMSCFRLARGFTGRDKIIKFDGCYHGHVDSLLVQAGSGALTHGTAGQRGRPGELRGAHDCPFRSITSMRCARPFARTRIKSPPSFSNRFRPTPDFIFRSENFLHLLRDECARERRACSSSMKS